MNAQKASPAVKLAGLAAAAVLIVLAVSVGVRLAGRRAGPQAAVVKPPPNDAVVDIKERIRHEEYRDGKLLVEIRGDRFFLGPDGRNHLEGSVEVTTYGPAAEVLSRMTADEIVYKTGSVRFAISGRVRVDAGGVLLEGGSFEYDKDRGLFRTASGAVFSSSAVAGTAPAISYAEGADEIRLSGGFRVEIAGAAGETSGKTVLSGDSLLYQRRGRRGWAEGRVGFSGGRCRGSAEAMGFDVAEDSSVLKSAVFAGAAELAILEAGPDGPEACGIRAERISAAFLPGTDRLSWIDALGDSRLSLPISTASRGVIECRRARLTFRVDGELARLDASGGFRAELEVGSAERRLLEGGSVSYDASTRVLRAAGEAGQPATADLSRARVEAPVILAGPDARDLGASGGAKCLLKPDGEGREAGFFSAAKPVFVTCSSLVFRGKTRELSFSGAVRAWQDSSFLLAEELDFLESAREMRGRGGVAVGFPQASMGESPTRLVEAGGEEMGYSSPDRSLSFKTNCYAELPGVRLSAETIAAVLKGEGIDSLTARVRVVLSKDRYEGRGDAAFYEAESGRITITGGPVLVDKEGRSTRGDKLTFDLGDGKIRVENEGQGRSTTVVKS